VYHLTHCGNRSVQFSPVIGTLPDIPDPLNLFQNTRPKVDGTIDYQPAATEAGEYITLKALIDCLVAISACPFDGEIDGKRPNSPKCTPLQVEFIGQ